MKNKDKNAIVKLSADELKNIFDYLPNKERYFLFFLNKYLRSLILISPKLFQTDDKDPEILIPLIKSSGGILNLMTETQEKIIKNLPIQSPSINPTNSDFDISLMQAILNSKNDKNNASLIFLSKILLINTPKLFLSIEFKEEVLASLLKTLVVGLKHELRYDIRIAATEAMGTLLSHPKLPEELFKRGLEALFDKISRDDETDTGREWHSAYKAIRSICSCPQHAEDVINQFIKELNNNKNDKDVISRIQQIFWILPEKLPAKLVDQLFDALLNAIEKNIFPISQYTASFMKALIFHPNFLSKEKFSQGINALVSMLWIDDNNTMVTAFKIFSALISQLPPQLIKKIFEMPGLKSKDSNVRYISRKYLSEIYLKLSDEQKLSLPGNFDIQKLSDTIPKIGGKRLSFLYNDESKEENKKDSKEKNIEINFNNSN